MLIKTIHLMEILFGNSKRRFGFELEETCVKFMVFKFFLHQIVNIKITF